jgi:hypothetical protein
LFNGFEIINKLDREITTAELVGRRIFVLVARAFPEVTTYTEVINWAEYTLVLPKACKISFAGLRPAPETVHYVYSPKKGLIHLSIAADASPLEGRTITQYILNEVAKWQRKNNLNK